jgi:ubiquinone/menaquinone biosynthesis C-methylase UbiE
MKTASTLRSVSGHLSGGSIAEDYERDFVPPIGGPFARDLVTEAALSPGERVLDVACGTGVVARLAAEAVGRSGTVAALDPNPEMLSVARSIPTSGAEIRWYESRAESIPLPDNRFDFVFCQLGLQFVADKLAAIREMHRVLAPGGRVLVSTPPPNRFFEVLEDALARHAGREAAAFVRTVFSLHNPTTIERFFRQAGFDDVAVRPDTKRLRLPAARDFLWQYVHSTPLAAMLSKLDAARIAALENDVVAQWQRWSTNGGMTYEQGMSVTRAQRHVAAPG